MAEMELVGEPGRPGRRRVNTDLITKQDDFLENLRAWRNAAEEGAAKRAVDQRDDQNFEAGDHWDARVKAEREQDGLPCLVINWLPAFKRLVVNQLADSRPSILVKPKDWLADEQTADVFRDLIRDIEYESDAEVWYERAMNGQTGPGLQYLMVVSQYESNDTFDQVIRITGVRNIFNVLPDPDYQEIDGKDMKFCFVLARIGKAEYLRKYGARAYRELEMRLHADARRGHWMPDGDVTLAQAYYVHDTELELAHIRIPARGDEPAQTLLVPYTQRYKTAVTKKQVELVKKRTVTHREIRWALIDGVHILDGNDDRTAGRRIPGTRIPIVPVIGEELDRDGDVDLRGMTRDAKDPMRMYDFMVSKEAQTVALAPINPYVIAEGQDEGREAMWRTAHKRPRGALIYKPTTFEGHLVGSPRRETAEPAIQAISMSVAQHGSDVKNVLGIHDASLGRRGPEQSGKAINARKMQGDISTSHFGRHFGWALKAIGQILVEWIPEIHDVASVKRLLGLDDQEYLAVVHAGNSADAEALAKRFEGIKAVCDLKKGRYRVIASMGPTRETRRDDALMHMTELVGGQPQIFAAIGDLLADAIDLPEPLKSKFIKRLSLLVPPEIRAAEQSGIPQEVMQQVQQIAAALEQCQQELAQAQEIIQTEQVKSESKEFIAGLNAKTQLAIANAQAKTTMALAAIEREHTHVQAMIDLRKAEIDRKTEIEDERAAEAESAE
jgi:hypothetical protein